MIYKRGKIYWFKFRHDGTLVRRSTGVSNSRKAAEMERDLRVALARGDLGLDTAKAAPTLREYAQTFIDQIAIERAERPETCRFYAEKLSRILECPTLRDARLSAIGELEIDRFVQWMHQRKPVPAVGTINRCLATLRRLLRMAYRHRLVKRVPQIRLLAGEKPRTFTVGPELEAAYLAAAPQPLRDVATLCLDAGLRLGECLALDADCATLEPAPGAPHGCLHVRRSKRDSGRRIVPLTPRAAAVIRGRLATMPARFLFESAPGQPYIGTSLDHAHARLRRQIGAPAQFVLHGLRHSFCTRLADSGADGWAIQRLAGHASITTSQRYVHRADAALGEAVARMAAAHALPPAE